MENLVESILVGVLQGIPWWLYVLAVVVVVAKALFGNPTHWYRVMGSYLALKRFKRLGESKGPAAQFHYLRTRDPFLFEEMILTALKKAGHRIKRNHRYTGDGGIDGQCWIDGEHYYIQAKRYKNHISAVHVKEFDEICRRKGIKGLFVHTGKTGKSSWRASASDRITIVSGDTMLTLLDGHYSLASERIDTKKGISHD